MSEMQLEVEECQVFGRVAEGAKQNCPQSRALAGVEISLDAQLEG
jgi:organic hydroperoxide reductase OsmC/OhrA